MRALIVLVLPLCLMGCDEEKRIWEGPCKETSTIISTSSGAPSDFTCTNRHHRMRVQLATGVEVDAAPSGDTSALVVCECHDDNPQGKWMQSYSERHVLADGGSVVDAIARTRRVVARLALAEAVVEAARPLSSHLASCLVCANMGEPCATLRLARALITLESPVGVAATAMGGHEAPPEVHERGWQWRPVGDGAFAPRSVRSAGARRSAGRTSRSTTPPRPR